MSVAETTYPNPGEILDDKYEIQEVLGTGAMGAVLRAHHVLRKAPVALKFVSPDIVGKRGVVDRFLNEAVAASKIDSEHVVKVFDVSKLESGAPYMVMEFLEGEDLAQLLRRHEAGLDEIPRAIHIALQILRGLGVAHAAKIVHRDMKPANCFVTGKDGDPDFIKIVDFGISKLREEGSLELTQAGSALGTPLYMSPEQARNPKDVDARSDLYAVAAILYELLSGRPPFVPASGTISELFVMLGTEEPKSLEDLRDDLPPGLWPAIEKGLAKKVERRYQSALEMAEALAPFADERSDYVVAKMLRTTAIGTTRRSSLRPPAADTAGSGTVLMDTPPSQPLAPTEAAGPPTAAGPLTAAQAGTAQGTLEGSALRRDEDKPRSTPLVWAIAVVAVAATALAAWALGQATATTKVDGDPAAPTAAPPPVPTVVAPSPPPVEEASDAPPVEPTTPSEVPTAAPTSPDRPKIAVPPVPLPPVPKKLNELGRD